MPAARRLPRQTPQVKIFQTRTVDTAGDIRRQVRRLERAYNRLSGGKKGLAYQANEATLAEAQNEAVKVLDERMRANRSHPTTGRRGLLQRTIKNKDAHIVTGTGFRFMVVSRVDTLMGRGNNYAFAIEFGSRYWVGKKLPFVFLGGPKGSKSSSERGRNREAQNNLSSYNRTTDRRDRARSSYRPNIKRGTDNGDPATGRKTPLGVHRFKSQRNANIVGDRIVGPREYDKRSANFQNKTKRYLVTIRRPVPEYAYGRTALRTITKNNTYYTQMSKILAGVGWEGETRTYLKPGRSKARA